MSDEFERKQRYIVFKISDIGNSLKGNEIRALACEYDKQRVLWGKPPLECVVVESDWPEYETVWKMIETRMTGRSVEAGVMAEAQESKSVSLCLAIDELLSSWSAHTRDDSVKIRKRRIAARANLEALYTAPQSLAPCPKCEETERIEAVATMNLGNEIIKNGALQATVAKQSAEIERLTKECDNIKQIEFPRRVKKVADGWRKRSYRQVTIIGKCRDALIGIALCSDSTMSSRSEIGKLARDALAVINAEKGGSA